jgi:hypothetical protein
MWAARQSNAEFGRSVAADPPFGRRSAQEVCISMQRIRGFWTVYMSRHQHPVDRALHIVGVPLGPWGGIVLIVLGQWRAGLAAITVGYGLQWIGHRIEHSHMGDWDMFVAVVKFGLRLVGIGRAARVEPEPAAHEHAAHQHAA